MERRRADEGQQPVARRASVLLLLLLLGFGALGGRLVQLQYVQHPVLDKVARDHLASVRRLRPKRGAIVDTRGVPLALSVEVPSCALDPKVAHENGIGLDATLDFLCTHLALTPVERDRLWRRTRLRDRVGESGARYKAWPRFVWVRRHLEPETHAKMQAAIDAWNATARAEEREARERGAAVDRRRIAGILFQPEYKRVYPQAALASHVVGLSDIDGRGLESAEKVCDPLLTGLHESVYVERDARRVALPLDGERAGDQRCGQTVVLTLDSTLQAIAEAALDKVVAQYNPKSVSALVVEPFTGSILAMAAWPRFDPNDPGASPVGHRLNPILASQFEPGSTFKPFVWGAAYEKGAMRLSDRFDCEQGAWRMPSGRVLHDSHGYGWLSAEMVLVKSSNIGMAKIAAALGMQPLYQAVRRCGFGEPTGIILPGEIDGTVHPLDKWTTYSMGSVPMGQEIAVTPLQLVMGYCAIANGGVLMKPRLLREVRQADGEVVHRFPPVPRRRIFSPSTTAMLRKVLRRVVKEGTGRRAKMDEYPLGGKTGTAQLMANATERAAGVTGYSPDRYVGSFVGVAPYDVPRMVILVSVREPHGAHYGGVVAAPAVKEIARQGLLYLNVPPRR